MDHHAHHVTFRLQDDAPLAPSPLLRRRAATLVLRHGADALLAFSVVDTHAHLLLACDRARAGDLAHRVMVSMRMRLALPTRFEPARIRPVIDRAHLRNSVRYVLRQHAHHGVTLDPLLDGTSLPDTIGLRVVVPALAERVREQLPRLGFDALALELLPALAALQGRAHASLPLAHLTDATAAAFGLEALAGRGAEVVTARHAAVHVARAATREVADALGLDVRSVHRLRARPCASELVRAVRAQWLLRSPPDQSTT